MWLMFFTTFCMNSFGSRFWEDPTPLSSTSGIYCWGTCSSSMDPTSPPTTAFLSTTISSPVSSPITSSGPKHTVYIYVPHHSFIHSEKRFIFWNGVEPRLCLTESHIIKELLSKYSSLSVKSWLQQQGSKHFIGRGLLMANGNDWYHQRHINSQQSISEIDPVYNVNITMSTVIQTSIHYVNILFIMHSLISEIDPVYNVNITMSTAIQTNIHYVNNIQYHVKRCILL